MTSKQNKFKSGFVSIIGHPNVGKSTLLNAIIDEKIAIVSSKAQTTRNVIRGIYTNDEMQIVFLDTPGIHRAQNKLGNYMNSQAKSSYHDVEGVLLVVDAKNENIEDYSGLVDDIVKTNIPLILILNKVDLMDQNELMIKVSQWRDKYNFKDIIAISAKKKNNIECVLEVIKSILPEGPCYYPKDTFTDNPESFLISEIVREKILSFTKEEVPHSVAVVTDKMQNTAKSLNLWCTIVVERDSQKGIIIGKQGSMIKKIGTSARQELEGIFQTKVRLETFVKVEKDWRNSNKYLKEFGYNND